MEIKKIELDVICKLVNDLKNDKIDLKSKAFYQAFKVILINILND